MRDSKSTSQVFVNSLGAHHFAHLRAVAEGVPVGTSAFQYLGIDHGNQAVTAHRETVEAVRSVALRYGEKAWRLVGLAIPLGSDSKYPTLAEFAATTSWASEFSESEVLEAYQERYPSGKKPTRRLRLRESLMETLGRMEKLSVVPPSPQDLIAGWFDQEATERLSALKVTTLGDLDELIATSTAWHAPAKAIGSVKAERIEKHLAMLIPLRPRTTVVTESKFPGGAPVTPSMLVNASPSPLLVLDSETTQESQQVDPDQWQLVVPTPEGHIAAFAPFNSTRASECDLRATNDGEAILEWVSTRARSPATKKTYLREAARFVIWLTRKQGLKTLSDLRAADCMSYLKFLSDIPAEFLSDPKTRPKHGDAGWAPFRGQLDPASQKQAIVIVAAMYTWLAAAAYLTRNPWAIVNKQVLSSQAAKVATSKAFSEVLVEKMLAYIDALPQSLEVARFRFILKFIESVGVRSSEIVSAKFKDVRKKEGNLFLEVTGKGSKVRHVSLPPQAVDAIESYLLARGLPKMEDVPGEIPLLSSVRNVSQPLTYVALYSTTKKWLGQSIRSACLNERELDSLKGASTHWLRHTFGTRAIARQVPPEVVQAQMGHSSIATTLNTYSKAPEKRLVDEIAKAFAGSSRSQQTPPESA